MMAIMRWLKDAAIEFFLGTVLVILIVAAAAGIIGAYQFADMIGVL